MSVCLQIREFVHVYQHMVCVLGGGAKLMRFVSLNQCCNSTSTRGLMLVCRHCYKSVAYPHHVSPPSTSLGHEYGNHYWHHSVSMLFGAALLLSYPVHMLTCTASLTVLQAEVTVQQVACYPPWPVSWVESCHLMALCHQHHQHWP